MHKKMIILICFCIASIGWSPVYAQSNDKPLRVGVVGMTHDHVNWILGVKNSTEFEIVGIVETNKKVIDGYVAKYGLSRDLLFSTMDAMIKARHPQAVTAYGSIYEHLAVVEKCAPLGIHVMVEKPLAVNMEHARKMDALAKKYHISLLTNYETTWYPTNHKAHEMVQNGDIGPLRKVVVHDGHKGPKEIGVSDAFFDWLTDPIQNGAGALTDFGCYGANLITWLVNGERPISVTAVTQTFKPNIYPKVDDEATIILEYKNLQGIIQASWNWPIGRKDMEIYGKSGVIFSENRNNMHYQLTEKSGVETLKLEELQSPLNDPFSLLSSVVNKSLKLPAFDPTSLENNLIVVEILEAAKQSAKLGKRVYLTK